MSDISNICPLCRKLMRVTIGTFYENDFCHCSSNSDEIKTLKVGRKNWDAMIEERDAALAEIARLRAELEETQMTRDKYFDMLLATDKNARAFEAERDDARKERDEARKIRDVVWSKVLSLRKDLMSSRNERERIYQEWLKMYRQRDEARKWAKYLLLVIRIYARHIGYALVVPKFPKKEN